MRQDYTLMTDSDSDLLFSIADEKQIQVVRMPYMLNGKEYLDDNGRAGSEKSFYDAMRAGAVPVTSLLPTEVYLEYFEPVLKERDLLFIAFSSQLSATIQHVYEAQKQLLQKYPERKLIVVDTLSVCGPQTLLVLAAQAMREEGTDIDTVAQWVLDNRLRAHAWFTVEDLKYLKRGGRISAVSATFGTVLDIKPILCLNKEGKLSSADKVQGRKKALRALADKMAEIILEPEKQTVLVMHADATEEAERLGELIKQKIPTLAGIRYQMLGNVIGTHCGPGTLTVCFMGKERA
jgi:DegV family protein with EDD domain